MGSAGHPVARAVRHRQYPVCPPTDRPRQSPARTYVASWHVSQWVYRELFPPVPPGRQLPHAYCRPREPRFTGVDCRRPGDFLAQVRRPDGPACRVRTHHVRTGHLSPVVSYECLIRDACALALVGRLRGSAWMGLPRTRSHPFSQWALCPSLDALGVPRLRRVSRCLGLAVELPFLNSAMALSVHLADFGLLSCSDLCSALPLLASVKLDRAAADQVGRVRHRDQHAGRCGVCFVSSKDGPCPTGSHRISLCLHEHRSLFPPPLPLPPPHGAPGLAVSLAGHP